MFSGARTVVRLNRRGLLYIRSRLVVFFFSHEYLTYSLIPIVKTPDLEY